MHAHNWGHSPVVCSDNPNISKVLIGARTIVDPHRMLYAPAASSQPHIHLGLIALYMNFHSPWFAPADRRAEMVIACR
jgi:hypothetical protein